MTLVEKLINEHNQVVQYAEESPEKDGFLSGMKKSIDIVKNHNGWISVDDLDEKLEGVKYLLLDEFGGITLGEIIKKCNAHQAHEYCLRGIDDEFIFQLITTDYDSYYGIYHDIALISDFTHWQHLPQPPNNLRKE